MHTTVSRECNATVLLLAMSSIQTVLWFSAKFFWGEYSKKSLRHSSQWHVDNAFDHLSIFRTRHGLSAEIVTVYLPNTSLASSILQLWNFQCCRTVVATFVDNVSDHLSIFRTRHILSSGLIISSGIFLLQNFWQKALHVGHGTDLTCSAVSLCLALSFADSVSSILFSQFSIEYKLNWKSSHHVQHQQHLPFS